MLQCKIYNLLTFHNFTSKYCGSNTNIISLYKEKVLVLPSTFMYKQKISTICAFVIKILIFFIQGWNGRYTYYQNCGPNELYFIPNINDILYILCKRLTWLRGHKSETVSLLVSVSLFLYIFFYRKWDWDQNWDRLTFMALEPVQFYWKKAFFQFRIEHQNAHNNNSQFW